MTWRDPLPPSKPAEQTQPSYPDVTDPIENFQPIRIPSTPPRPVQKPVGRSPRSWGCGWCACLPILLVFLIVVGAYFLAPFRTNLLILGIDVGEGRAPAGSYLGRSDTMIIVTVVPLKPYVGMLSIPRDLWVPIAGVGENRINTAHFFAEANQAGSGPAAAEQVIQDNFHVPVTYYIRSRFENFESVIDAMGGITVNLDKPSAGFSAGEHQFTGVEALAFVRSRKGADDFTRMQDTQVLLIAASKKMLSPLSWPRIPAVASAILKAVDTNVPLWQWPRLGLALLRVGPKGIDNHTLTREMTNPFTTTGGAQVLGPNWDKILPLVKEMFGQ
jgi:polyisoprenyl-teichoic acid--peptidoglycan teichoic acid transferase